MCWFNNSWIVSCSFTPQRFAVKNNSFHYLSSLILSSSLSFTLSHLADFLPSLGFYHSIQEQLKRIKLTCAKQNDVESEVAVEGFEDLQGESLGHAERLSLHGLRRVQQQDDFIAC